MSSQGVWEIWSLIEPGCGSAVADCCDFFTRSAWVLVMIKPHANLCPLNQSVDSMSPNTWEHFSSGKWCVAFCLTWFRLMDCSWNWCCPILALALLVHGHAGKDSSKDCRCLFMSSQGVWEVWSVIGPGCGSAAADCLDVLEEVLECLWLSNHMLTYVHWIKVWILWVLSPESTSLRANDVLHSAWLGSDWWTVLMLSFSSYIYV